MNSSELLRINTAGNLQCRQLNNLIGPTGSAGPTGPQGPVYTNYVKSFTLFLDYSAANAISRVYVPPGLFTTSPLAEGGTFTANVGTDLIFLGNPSIAMQNTTYPFIVGIFANGYISSNQWQLMSPSQIRSGIDYVNVTTTADYSATIGANLAPINGGQLSNYPITGTAAGFLAMITLFYL